MCKWGTYVPLRVWIDAAHSHTGAGRWDTKKIDACIAPLVKALNEGGIVTLGSCCGHGDGDATIVAALPGIDGPQVLSWRAAEATDDVCAGGVA